MTVKELMEILSTCNYENIVYLEIGGKKENIGGVDVEYKNWGEKIIREGEGKNSSSVTIWKD